MACVPDPVAGRCRSGECCVTDQMLEFMRRILLLTLFALAAMPVCAQNRNSRYVGEVSVGGLGYKDNLFLMAETVHGARIAEMFFVGGGVRATYHGEMFSSADGRERVNTGAMSLFADAKLYITPDWKFCPYVNMQVGAQAVFGPSSSPYYSMDGFYVKPMVGGGIGCVYRRFNFGLYVAVNFEVAEGGIKLGFRF